MREVLLVDGVGEVDQDAFGVHAERAGDELGVHGVDQVGEAGAAQNAGRVPQESRMWLI